MLQCLSSGESKFFFLTKLKVIKVELVTRHANTRFSFGKDENMELGDTCEVTVLFPLGSRG